VLVTATGMLVDQLLFILRVLVSDAGAAAPLWLSALWPVFATTCMHAFARLGRDLRVAALVGGAGGYASYRVGVGVSDIAFGCSPGSGLVLAALWGVLFPSLLVLSNTLQRQEVRGGGRVCH
jgi:hypothetical protein